MKCIKSLLCCEPDQVEQKKPPEPKSEPNDVFNTTITFFPFNQEADGNSTKSFETKPPSDFVPENECKHHKPLSESRNRSRESSARKFVKNHGYPFILQTCFVYFIIV